MKNYIEIKITNISSTQSEILIAQLNELGFDGFEDGDNFLSAFIEEKKFNEDKLRKIVFAQQLTYSKSIIEEKNWNEEWEKNFEPVIVDDFVAVRAEFHKPIKNVEHEIIITPKMSFGTGHHATTYMMMQEMRLTDFKNKNVFDFGTGTGILSILAEKLGAASITAIDNDEWSIDNAEENIKSNNCKKIKTQLSDTPPSSQKFDIILANINKNVILRYLPFLCTLLLKNGQLLVSGLLQRDEADVVNIAIKSGLEHNTTINRGKWITMNFTLNFYKPLLRD